MKLDGGWRGPSGAWSGRLPGSFRCRRFGEDTRRRSKRPFRRPHRDGLLPIGPQSQLHETPDFLRETQLVSFAKREFQGLDHLRIAIDWKRQARDVALLAGIGLFLALLNPFGSVTEVPLIIAIPYWVSLILWGGLAGEGLAWLLRKFAPALPLWAFLGALSVLMTAAVLPAVAAEQALVMDRPIQANEALRFVFYIWLIALSVSTLVVLGFRAFGARSGMFDPEISAPSPAPSAAPSAAPSPAPSAAPSAAQSAASLNSGPSPFVDRLPIRLRTATLYAVESEDHYLRVHTSGGEELILMRIADAIRELAGRDGLQTHRSWWVAREGLADTARANGKLVLKLKSGAEAPVSPTYLQAVKAKGWI